MLGNVQDDEGLLSAEPEGEFRADAAEVRGGDACVDGGPETREGDFVGAEVEGCTVCWIFANSFWIGFEVPRSCISKYRRPIFPWVVGSLCSSYGVLSHSSPKSICLVQAKRGVVCSSQNQGRSKYVVVIDVHPGVARTKGESDERESARGDSHFRDCHCQYSSVSASRPPSA